MQHDLRDGERELKTECEARVNVTSNRLSSEHVDGAWWPRSTQLSTELPALLSSLSGRLGQVVAVGYPRDGWMDVRSQLDIAGHPVQLIGFCADDPASVIVIGADGHHLTLRVIAPETSARAAQTALAKIPERASDGAVSRSAAAAARSVADVAQKLAQHEGRDDEKRTTEIMRWCEEASHQFETARIQSFVPILVEHVVQNRMLQTRATKPTSSGDAAGGARVGEDRASRVPLGESFMTTPASIGPVVVGIDGSRAAIDAALWAADEASTRGVALRLVHVIDVEDEVHRDLDEDPADVARDWPETESGGASLLAAATAVRDTGKPVLLETEILWGELDSTLVEESRHATMVCVGSTGISSFASSILGSTAAALAAQAHGPVAVIRSARSVQAEPEWVVALVDDSPSSDSVVDYALDEGCLRGAPVLAVGVSRRHHKGIRIDDFEPPVAAWRKDRPTLHLHPDVVPIDDVAGFLAHHDEMKVQLAVVCAVDADATAAIVGPHRQTRQPHRRCSVLVVR